MIRDRGKIKWTSMMLPEHVKLLRDWVKEDSWEEKIEIDEQQLDLMNETLSTAMEMDQSVAITHYQNRNYETVTGKVHYWDEMAGRLHIVDQSGEIHRISITAIAGLRMAD